MRGVKDLILIVSYYVLILSSQHTSKISTVVFILDRERFSPTELGNLSKPRSYS